MSVTRLHSMTFATALALVTLQTLALDEGRTAQGVHYVSGGVSLDERESLQAERMQHSLWVVVATVGSGAFTGDTRVVIRDAAGRTVFDRQLDGPWLFIDLPVGRYTVQASAGGASQERRTHVHPGDHHQMILRMPAESHEQSTRLPGTVEAERPAPRAGFDAGRLK